MADAVGVYYASNCMMGGKRMWRALLLVGSTGVVFGMALALLSLYYITRAVKSDVDRFFASGQQRSKHM